MGWGHHGWGFGGVGGWDMVIGALMMLLLWGGLLAGLFFVIRAAIGAGRGRTEPGGAGKAMRILSERYAKGEISADEFKEMKEVLTAG